MFKKSIFILTAAVLMAGSAFAGESNIKPARMSGNTPAAETARARAEAARSNEPGFWRREWNRSGLAKLFKPSEWRKNQGSTN